MVEYESRNRKYGTDWLRGVAIWEVATGFRALQEK